MPLKVKPTAFFLTDRIPLAPGFELEIAGREVGPVESATEIQRGVHVTQRYEVRISAMGIITAVPVILRIAIDEAGEKDLNRDAACEAIDRCLKEMLYPNLTILDVKPLPPVGPVKRS